MSTLGVYRGFWICAFAALIVVGAPRVGKPNAVVPLLDRGRDGSINSLLQRTLGGQGLASQVAQWLERVPRERPILIVIPNQQNSPALTAGVLSYLAWPRPAQTVVGAQESIAHLREFPARYGAVAFCYLPPPPGFSAGTKFGPALVLVAAPVAAP